MPFVVNSGDAIMSKIKIVHVQVIPKLSGAQLFSLSLLSSLSSELYDKYIIFSADEGVTLQQKEEVVTRFSEAGAKVIWLKSLRRSIGVHDVQCFWKLVSIFKKHGFDIVHTNSTKPGIIARIAARVAGVKKIIHTVHGIAYHDNLPLWKRVFFYLIEAFSTPFCHYNICVNKFYLKYYRWLPFARSMTIYNGLDFLSLSEKSGVDVPERTYDITQKEVKLLFVGRLDEQKDPLTLLQAFKLLSTSGGRRFKLSMVGDGEFMEACKLYCIENDLIDDVAIHGWVSQPQSLYATSDIFVCPSIYEAFGFTFVEAAYYGLPIVTTNVEGIPEVVLDNYMGYLVQSKSPEQLAFAILNIANNQKAYQTFAQNAHDSVVSRFSIENMIAGYKTIYEA